MLVSTLLFDVKPIDNQLGKQNLCSDYNIAKSIAGVIQTCYASFELYQAGIDHIPRYGYAAYQLTVVPYLLMSVVNLIGAVLEPTYPTIYLVENKCHEDPPKVAGAVGQATLKPEAGIQQLKWSIRSLLELPRGALGVVAGVLTMVVFLTPLVVISLLTKWKLGESNVVQQTAVVMWLGTIYGSPILYTYWEDLVFQTTKRDWIRSTLLIPVLLGVGITPVWMWVQVVTMISTSNVCTMVG